MRGNKYRAVKTEVDGILFDSKKEAKRYKELKLLEKAGDILDLILQPPYEIKINGIKICIYKADFQYFDKQKDAIVTEDCKGFKTPVYRLKKKLMKALYGIDILET